MRQGRKDTQGAKKRDPVTADYLYMGKGSFYFFFLFFVFSNLKVFFMKECFCVPSVPMLLLILLFPMGKVYPNYLKFGYFTSVRGREPPCYVQKCKAANAATLVLKVKVSLDNLVDVGGSQFSHQQVLLRILSCFQV